MQLAQKAGYAESESTRPGGANALALLVAAGRALTALAVPDLTGELEKVRRPVQLAGSGHRHGPPQPPQLRIAQIAVQSATATPLVYLDG
jgi:hypothetical protein